jgi:hypothetical protein
MLEALYRLNFNMLMETRFEVEHSDRRLNLPREPLRRILVMHLICLQPYG